MEFLKNIRVAVRLPFVVALALVALIVFAITSLTTLSTVKVGGPKEQAITEQNILLADILPPPAYLVETELASLELANAVRAGDTGRVETTPRRSRPTSSSSRSARTTGRPRSPASRSPR
jgi:hypothetical protein